MAAHVPRQRRALTLFVATTVAYGVALAWTALTLPERVITHFDAAGRADDFSTRTEAVAMWGGLGVFILGGGWMLSRLTVRSRELVNMPEAWKDHWLDDGVNFAAYRLITRAATLEMTSATAVLLIVMMVATSYATTSGNEIGVLLWITMGVYLAWTAWWCFAFYGRLRPPSEGSPQADQPSA